MGEYEPFALVLLNISSELEPFMLVSCFFQICQKNSKTHRSFKCLQGVGLRTICVGFMFLWNMPKSVMLASLSTACCKVGRVQLLVKWRSI